MSDHLPSDDQHFVAWYIENYDRGFPDDSEFAESIGYLRGLVDAVGDGDLRFGGARRAIDVLMKARSVCQIISMHKVGAPRHD
jgi:hypothetical protein